jgi:hypothetical protein
MDEEVDSGVRMWILFGSMCALQEHITTWIWEEGLSESTGD